MTDRRKVFFYPVPGQTSQSHWQSGTHACSDRSLTMLLAEHSSGSGKPSPDVGYRLGEYKRDSDSSSFDHGGSTTHYRKSPWVVASVEEYVANTGTEKFSEVVFCYCDYAPLPDEENPWIETRKSIVSPDSFGGDHQKFDQFVANLTLQQAESYEIVDTRQKQPASV